MINAEMKVVRFGENNVIATSIFHCPNGRTDDHFYVTTVAGDWSAFEASSEEQFETYAYTYTYSGGVWSTSSIPSAAYWYHGDDEPVEHNIYYYDAVNDVVRICTGNHQ